MISSTEKKKHFQDNSIPVKFSANALDFLKNVKINKVSIDKNKKKWMLFIETEKIIDYKSIDTFKEETLENFPELKHVDVCIKYVNRESDNLDSIIKEYWENILYLIGKIVPSFKGWERQCNYAASEDILTLKICSPIGVRLLESKNITGLIEDAFYREFNRKIIVNIELSEMLSSTDTVEKYYSKQKKKEKKYIDTIIKDKKNVHTKNRLSTSNVLLGKRISGDLINISLIKSEMSTCIFLGKIIKVSSMGIRNNKKMVSLDITDYTGSITVKIFLSQEQWNETHSKYSLDQWLTIRGYCQYDKYDKDLVIFAQDINMIEVEPRNDAAQEKRIEMHAHTQSSAMDGIASVDMLIRQAAQWGHKAIAVTDHGVIQAFPDAYEAGLKHGIKIIYGVEAYLVDDPAPIVLNANNKGFEQCFVVIDVETTGLCADKDRITELAAVKIINGMIIDTYNTLVNPGIPIPAKITHLTGITDELVKNAPLLNEVFDTFAQFIGDAVITAHNAKFDMGFINHISSKSKKEINNPVLDTLQLSRVLYKNLKSYRLSKVAEHLKINQAQHHRALNDAKATAEILIAAFEQLKSKRITQLNRINDLILTTEDFNKLPFYHATIIAKNKKGLKNLYKLISISHMNYFYRKPRIPKSLFKQYNRGLIIGTACESGELFSAIVERKEKSIIDNLAEFYDYYEIQPLYNNKFLLDNGRIKSMEDLININKEIVKLGEKFNKPVIATGDVHFVNPEDECFRRILMAAQGFQDAEHQAPLYLKSTDEMLEEFEYLGKVKAYEVVVENTNYLNGIIENLEPIPKKLHPPTIEGSDKAIRDMSVKRAKEIYGDKLPKIVNKRLLKELDSIINNNFAVLYLITHKIVKKSLSDGYLVGSRGSVGSSLVATMCNITEVNPLPPHYVCPACKYSSFDKAFNEYSCGVDLTDRLCPSCNYKLRKDGYNIPFEVFLGFEGDKVPDIDLNFSGEYQSTAHKYTESLFGKQYVFRAGTISTIAEKTAYGFVKGYMEEKKLVYHNAEVNRLIKGCTGVKRTTGQHPGGVIIVPPDKDIYDFTPIQHPADEKKSNVITTHFDYHSISSKLVKLDILGHDDPTVIKMLEDLTGVNALDIPLDDPDTLSIFSCTEKLGICSEEINSKVGTFGIPEFGTRFVRQMLEQTKPTTFGELLRISGLSHGTDVWLNNAQDLIKNGIARLSEVISTRDDIMVYLINKGIEPTISFNVMENVRKGKGLTKDEEDCMRANKVPEWFISSCKKIKYMFPKAHAVAYVIMAFRIAYFKVHYPEAFYTAYFTVRAVDFDADLIVKDKDNIKKHIRILENNNGKLSQKEKNLLTILEVALEMYSRKISMLPVDLYNSHAVKYKITDKGILPSLNSLQGLGGSAANNIIQARKKGRFISIEDLVNRSRISKTVVEILNNHGCLKDMPEKNQLSLF